MKDGEESQGRSEESKSDQDPSKPNLDRRSFLQASALAAGGAALAPLAANAQSDDEAATQDFAALSGDRHGVAQQHIKTLQRLMSSHELSAQELLDIYLRRIQLIDKGLDLNAIIQLNPDARHIAVQLDQERRAVARAVHAEGQHRHR